MILEYIKTEIKSTYGGTEVLGSNLLDLDMVVRMNILLNWGNGIYLYTYMVRSGETRTAALPCEHFDREAGKWLVPETPPEWEDANAQQFAQYEVPTWTPAVGYAPYDAGSSNWGYYPNPPDY